MIPKWDPRSRMGIYVGRSPAHASNVALVLNPRTGHISPQYHVIYDDDFTTVPFLRKGQVPPHWEELVSKSAIFSRTDNNIDTWDSLQTPDQIEEGEIISTNDALPREADSEGAQSTENAPIPVATNDSQTNPIVSHSNRVTKNPSSNDNYIQITQNDEGIIGLAPAPGHQ